MILIALVPGVGCHRQTNITQ